jgi:acetyl esterase/lipase
MEVGAVSITMAKLASGTFMTKHLLIATGFLLMTLAANAAPPGEAPYTPIYDGAAPFGDNPQETPHVLIYLPDNPGKPTPAVLDCPGGGYGGLAMQHEGTNEANWFKAHGIATFVLAYRMPHGRHQVPLGDAQRAMRYIRSQAAKFNVDPNKIGVMGFSAGGHLASTLETHFDAGNPSATDPIDRVSCRPDFAILVYPVITMKEGETHSGSKANLLGPNPDPALVASFSNETQVTAQTPPTILFHSVDDNTVSIQNSRDMLAALSKAGVPGELHEYSTGNHGFGFGANPDNSPKGWFDVTLYDWLKKMGFAS